VPRAERAPEDGRIVLSGAATPPAEALALLARGEMEVLGLMPDASNSTFLSRVRDDRSSLLAVYKPRAGEAPLWDFPPGSLSGREVAAYLLSAALGWPSVPPTIFRDGPHGPGAIQVFIEADFEHHFFTLRDRHPDEFRAVAAFDVIANNADRKGGHCLLGPRERIWVIDHGVCFSPEPKIRTVIWDFAGEPVPAALLADVCRVAEELRTGAIRGELQAFLTEAEVDATAARADALSRSGRFPHPLGRRPYPWPPV